MLGTVPSRNCPECNVELPSTTAVCDQCGHLLDPGAEAPPSPSDPPGALWRWLRWPLYFAAVYLAARFAAGLYHYWLG